ncbi:unnamed protein product [Phytomonas sp. EM1]|nr:unnamed protein product [Phytomonas sp. EM1]|eukprot:CCW61012.1 unnamed protein product [Phytomonas sp. isolate EM1]
MDRCVPAPWTIRKSGPLIRFRVIRRTIITNIELDVRQTSKPFVIWAYVLPPKSCKPADEINALSPPYVLAGGDLAADGDAEAPTVPCLQQRWELAAGSRMCLLIAPRSAPREAVQRTLAIGISPTQHASHSSKRSSLRSEPDELLHEGNEEVSLDGVVEVRLVGLSVGLPFFEEEPEWRPLLVRQWLELKSYVREATVVMQPVATHDSLDMVKKEESFAMHQGDVKKAVAVRADGNWVKWYDGSVGLMDELKFFHRTYKPARANKVVRVRRHPHRYSDVIGEIPFGLEVHSLGRETDQFTGELYALIYLPEDPSYFSYIQTYELTSCGGVWVWGWSKIIGKSGLPFLVEVEPSSKSKAVYMVSDEQTKYSPLSKGSIFTCARDNKGVRIRKKPSLKSEKIGQLQPNEVKEAIALLRVENNHPVPSAGDGDRPSVPSEITKDTECFEFVEWKDGGFSLIHNSHDTFLTKVELISGAEAFFPSTPLELPKSVVKAHNACDDSSTDTPESDQKRFKSETFVPSFL